ncbi:hypothetical protein B0T11DRAFT_350387 [Plectosphaerella cucumerina]|uniref:Uncharacterized protein n=1 Tax=Plectosphaerella cucumerina TaxID=40658 RepID=A0A8K0TJU6_9PEZI|nr:hypothetical protein B0T11DRAFT_350387 [Plectosphaerella cucumerina]
MPALPTLITSLAPEFPKKTAIGTINSIMSTPSIIENPTAVASASPTCHPSATGTACPIAPVEAPDVPVIWAYVLVLLMPIVFVALAIYSNRQETLYQRDQVRNRLRNEIELAEMRRYWFPWRDALDEDELNTEGYRDDTSGDEDDDFMDEKDLADGHDVLHHIRRHYHCGCPPSDHHTGKTYEEAVPAELREMLDAVRAVINTGTDADDDEDTVRRL